MGLEEADLNLRPVGGGCKTVVNGSQAKMIKSKNPKIRQAKILLVGLFKWAGKVSDATKL